MKFKIGDRVRRTVDGVVVTVYDIAESRNVILCNWINPYGLMDREEHVVGHSGHSRTVTPVKDEFPKKDSK